MAEQLLLVGAHGAGKRSPASGNVWISGAVHPGESSWRPFRAQKDLVTFAAWSNTSPSHDGVGRHWVWAGTVPSWPSVSWICLLGMEACRTHSLNQAKRAGILGFADELPKSQSRTFSSPYPEGVALGVLQTHLSLNGLCRDVGLRNGEFGGRRITWTVPSWWESNWKII